MDQLASLTAELIAKTQLLQTLLQQQQYDEAQSCMDERLALIARLTQFAQDNPVQRQGIIALAKIQLTQEQELINHVCFQYNVILKQLTQITKSNKAEQAYRTNVQES